MARTPSYVDLARRTLRDAESDLLVRIGRDTLEETAFPVYTNTFPPAAYLGWNRVVHAQRLLVSQPRRERALDFGSGLGVMLPFLAQNYRVVDAYDVDPRPTRLMVERMTLPNVTAHGSLDSVEGPFNAIVALDVLEHVNGLETIYAELLDRTDAEGCWVISGPTENWLYHVMRRLSRTSGEGHLRTIYDVFSAVPNVMVRSRVVRLPFGSPIPLFLVGLFERTA